MEDRGERYDDVLPAYAGMIPQSLAQTGNAWRAPRVCGDDPTVNVYGKDAVRCSPRMRG